MIHIRMCLNITEYRFYTYSFQIRNWIIRMFFCLKFPFTPSVVIAEEKLFYSPFNIATTNIYHGYMLIIMFYNRAVPFINIKKMYFDIKLSSIKFLILCFFQRADKQLSILLSYDMAYITNTASPLYYK